jgi:hypothetical protein
MSRSGRAFGSLGIGELLTAKAGALLLLGALVAVAAVLYGNAYAGSGHAAEGEEEEEARHAAEEGEEGERPKGNMPRRKRRTKGAGR